MERNEMRNALIQSAIHIVACEGIDKVKVDKVAHAADVNVAYGNQPLLIRILEVDIK